MTLFFFQSWIFFDQNFEVILRAWSRFFEEKLTVIGALQILDKSKKQDGSRFRANISEFEAFKDFFLILKK